MGRDKALLPVRGVPMAVTVARVLEAAGAVKVIAVGGDEEGLAAVGLEVVPDPRQGDGPLAGISAALHAALDFDVVAVLACDLVDASAEGMRRTIDALSDRPDAAVAVPIVDGRPEPLHTAWRPSAVTEVDRALDAGERAVHAVLSRLPTVEVHDLDPAWLHNVNFPEQLGHT